MGLRKLIAAALLLMLSIPSTASSLESGEECPYPLVSLYRLLAAPGDYHDCPVWVRGFVVLEFEGTAIYPHIEDYCRRMPTNSLWLDFFGSDRDAMKVPEGFRGGYAIVRGIFNADRRGHMGLFGATITKISAIEPDRRLDIVDCP